MTLERLELLDWKRRVFSVYESVRNEPDAESAWKHWRRVRDELFEDHPQSPLPAAERSHFAGLSYFSYDPAYRVIAETRRADEISYEMPSSGEEGFTFTRIGVAGFTLAGTELELELYWLEGYGGGLWLPFRDDTGGRETYGAGRYLFDTIKGADLGANDEGLVLDFNFAYNPSCAYDPRWVCPLAPPPNRLGIPIRVGERYGT
jgi:uncharacterized protein (DUF1684 family)